MKYKILIILFFLIVFITPLSAKDKEVDYLALSALLVKGGDYLKAEKALNKFNVDLKNADITRFYTIKGLIKLRLQQYKAARDSYLSAIVNGQLEKTILIYLAQSYYGLKDFDNTLLTLNRQPLVWENIPRAWMLKALSLWGAKRYSETMDTLLAAEQRFPDNKLFSQRKILLLIELGLYQKAVKAGLEMLNRDDTDAVDYQAIGKAMLEAGQYDHALSILEKSVLLYPNNIKLLRMLSRTYISLNKFYVAANILEKAAVEDDGLYSEVAELYRKSNRSEQALYFNQIIIDQKVKYKQRLAIYLDAGRFDDAIAMKDTLYRVGLLDDGNIRYALAYAYFSLGKFTFSEKYLDGIKQVDLFRKATQLRKVMLSCESNPYQC